ncbi:MAG: hypothetical protein LQ338_004936 [Usnochroma carphineum]|nr:MAG: hypothetical protein LQ338_004936 [Usnochroma carphineum]
MVSVGTKSSAASTSTCATSPPTSSFSGSPWSFRSADGPLTPLTPLSPLSLDGASDTPATSASLSPAAAKVPKKKSSSFFKFLSVKEPSTQAFEAYQEQMKKRGTTQSGRANAVGLPGVSSAKLPPTVPKVNSKWDGVPQAAKERRKRDDNLDGQSLCSAATRPLYTSRSTGSNMTGLTACSTSSTSSAASAPRANGKLMFDNDTNNLSDLYGWESGSPSNASSTRSLPLESGGSSTSASTPCREGSPSFLFQPPSICKSSCALSANHPPPVDPSSNSSSPIVRPALQSPASPNGSLHALPLSPRGGHLNSITPAKGSFPADDKRVVLASSGANVLGPPVSATNRAGTTRSPVAKANPNTPVRTSPPQTNSILKRPALTSHEVWPIPPPPADDRNAEKTLQPHAPKSRLLSMFSKGA